MAASEICSFLDQSCDDDLNVDELSIDSSLLMSFLEDSQAEEGDDETLRAMIKSLEPVIMNQDSCRFSEADEAECCSTYLDHHPHFEWTDMEMDYSGYFMGRFTGNMAESGGGLEEYSQLLNHEMAMEEDDYIGLLWQWSLHV